MAPREYDDPADVPTPKSAAQRYAADGLGQAISTAASPGNRTLQASWLPMPRSALVALLCLGPLLCSLPACSGNTRSDDQSDDVGVAPLQALPTFSALEVTADRSPLKTQPGHLSGAAVRFTCSGEVLESLRHLLPTRAGSPMPDLDGAMVSGSIGNPLGRGATHHRVHLSADTHVPPSAPLDRWLASWTPPEDAGPAPAGCEGLDVWCRGAAGHVIVRRHVAGATVVDVVTASVVTPQLTQAALDTPLAPSSQVRPDSFGIDVDNEALRVNLWAPTNVDAPLPLRTLRVRGRLAHGHLRARARWETTPQSTAPWRSQDDDLLSPRLESWCGDSACAVVSVVPSPVELRATFPPLPSPPATAQAQRVAAHLAFAWPHDLAAATQAPLQRLPPAVAGFAASGVESLGAVRGAGVRWSGDRVEAFARAPKPTVDTVAGLLAYAGSIEVVGSGADQVSRATVDALAAPVFLALDDERPQSHGWVALSRDTTTFAQLRKLPRIRYGPPWVYANIPSPEALGARQAWGVEALRALVTVDQRAFVLDLEARIREPRR